MIEDTDYNYNSSKTASGNYNTNKPTMQTSRLSVFLQQNKDPTHSGYSKPSNYGFSNVYSHDSPVIRRTRNDDEYYGGFVSSTRSSSSRRSGRGVVGVGPVPGYQQETLNSIRRSKERSQTQTDSPSRFRRTPSSRGRPAAPVSQSSSSKSSKPSRPSQAVGKEPATSRHLQPSRGRVSKSNSAPLLH